MNPFAEKVQDYLWEKKTRERKQALLDLAALGVFSDLTTEDQARRAVGGYLDRNPNGFCDEGITRFRTALGLLKKRTAILEVEIELAPSWDTNDSKVLEGRPFTETSVIATKIRSALKEHIAVNYGDGFELTSATLKNIGKVQEG